MNDETYVDERGVAWVVPTAYAYAMVCKARDKWQNRAELALFAVKQLNERIEALERKAKPISHIDAYKGDGRD